MTRRIIAMLMALLLVMSQGLMALAEEEDWELLLPGEATQEKGDSALGEVQDSNEDVLEALGKKDWTALAAAAKKTGDWREDLVSVAESQQGYTEDADGMTIYTAYAGYKDPQTEWTAQFVSWVAAQAGLTEKQFPRENTYNSFVTRMTNLNAVKRISRANYPLPGDVALVEKDNQSLVGIVIYVSNGMASVMHGDDNGAVTKEVYVVGDAEFARYVDLNVLMERAGVEVGKGGEVPEIPEGGIAAWTNTNAVYMRKEPTTASKRVTTVKKAGTALVVTSGAMQEDGYIWYAVEYGRYAGYIRGDLLRLDVSAIPTATPAPTATPVPTATLEPTATPAPTEVPGCITCAYEAGSVALPEECLYEHLKAMGAEESYRFMSSLLADDYLTFMLYVNCHNAHVLNGAAAVICYTGCEQSIFTPVAPGAEHSEGCGWYQAAEATEAPAVTEAPTAEPTVEPTAEPTVEPTAEPTAEPTEAPEAAGDCDKCAAESEYWGVALPESGCIYTQLFSLTAEEAYALLSDLDWNDYSAYRMYIDAHNDHVLAGAAPVICYGDVCGAGTWTAPGAAHTENCPWYTGLSTEERVVNIVVNQPAAVDGVLPGEEATFTFEVYGAEKYQWFQVKTETTTTGAVTETKEITRMLVGEKGTTLTVTASDATDGVSYFCEATLSDGTVVVSKRVTLNVQELILAKAILGEEVFFTYNYEGAEKYQWYVKAPKAENYEAITDATTNRLSLTAEMAMSGAMYYCAAMDSANNQLAQSSCYSYEIPVYEKYDVYSCTSHDLCKYVNELANMTRAERYEIMSNAWNVARTSASNEETTLAELVRLHWREKHMAAYPTLLCTCNTFASPDGAHGSSCPWAAESTSSNERQTTDPCDKYDGRLPDGVLCAYEVLRAINGPVARYNYLYDLWLEAEANTNQDYTQFISAYMEHVNNGDEALVCSCHYMNPIKTEYAPGTNHETTCPWYFEQSLDDRIASEPEFEEWANTATAEMIARALGAKSLNHMVFEEGKVYIAREENPRASIDENGYIYDIATGLKIARRYNGYIYPIAEDPAPVQ